jgi:hypothetical protein
MQVSIENNEIVIRLPIAPRTSKSGKSLVIASTNGNIQTGTEYKGKPVVVGVNCYVKA